ncbi:hypothetical protein A6R68_21195, partial [Neotoma lepida]
LSGTSICRDPYGTSLDLAEGVRIECSTHQVTIGAGEVAELRPGASHHPELVVMGGGGSCVALARLKPGHDPAPSQAIDSPGYEGFNVIRDSIAKNNLERFIIKQKPLNGTRRKGSVEQAKMKLQKQVKALQTEIEDRTLRNFKLVFNLDPKCRAKITGHKGLLIAQICTEHNVTVRFPKKGSHEMQDQVTITGYKENTLAARDALMRVLHKIEKTISKEIPLNYQVRGNIIGCRGKTIHKIMDQYQVDIRLPPKGSYNPNITLTGLPDNVQKAIDHILNLEKYYLSADISHGSQQEHNKSVSLCNIAMTPSKSFMRKYVPCYAKTTTKLPDDLSLGPSLDPCFQQFHDLDVDDVLGLASLLFQGPAEGLAPQGTNPPSSCDHRTDGICHTGDTVLPLKITSEATRITGLENKNEADEMENPTEPLNKRPCLSTEVDSTPCMPAAALPLPEMEQSFDLVTTTATEVADEENTEGTMMQFQILQDDKPDEGFPLANEGESTVSQAWGKVYRRVVRMYDDKNHVGRYTSEEIQKLKELWQQHGNDWITIGAAMGRSPSSVKDRCRLLKDTCNRGKWTEEEERILGDVVRELTCTEVDEKVTQGVCWTTVAQRVGTRSAKQCRAKWLNYLNWKQTGGIAWTRKDEVTLIHMLAQLDVADENEIHWDDLAKGWKSVRSPQWLRNVRVNGPLAIEEPADLTSSCRNPWCSQKDTRERTRYCE